MTDAGGEEQLVALGLVEHKTFEDTGLTIVVVETAIESGLGKGLGAEHAAIGTDDLEGDAVIDELLSVLVLHHTQRIVGCARHLNLVLLTQPLHILYIFIILHTDGSLRFGRLGMLYDDIIVLLFLTATC